MANAHEAALKATAEEQAACIRDRFEAVIPAERPRLRALAWKFGLPQEDLDDAVQEVFSKAWAGLAGFRGDAELSTWITRIAVHSFTSRKRTWVRRIRALMLDDAAMQHATARAGVPAERAEAFAVAQACVQKLPPKLRQVFVLRYLEEMTCAEVATVLAIPEATVRTRIFHARKKLRAMMKGYEP